MPRQEEILGEVHAAFEQEERINLFRSPIHLAYSDGILTLNGEVEHIVAKKLCLALAAAVPGVDGLVDRLRVMPTLGMDDGAIRDYVRDALLAWYVLGVNGVVNWLTVREYMSPLPDGELHVELPEWDDAAPVGQDQGIKSTADCRMLTGRD